ncbi:sphinganine kinase LCB5 KNAG_0E02730 [Huiozyma naganishii CBS 8797]|uniref:sphingosine kinase n=1 Tax=Huiozyma naganishii (strain ATCC MYA-139 / BCRC 22969 / CBS 8797 / KCTC 17520 / NBRC 10181 / NCYC 3082 / Yp74L-3) TaxID=1071383 RepID=J7RZB0_HUIN7|nr:hypothetical protein KNAG_0E02730 [Kazachstania naganishii CBS 8797]CCK70532.1 hypothetical protein KNAG_0E02730 [Kazachstania naganishii CBS 8797]
MGTKADNGDVVAPQKSRPKTLETTCSKSVGFPNIDETSSTDSSSSLSFESVSSQTVGQDPIINSTSQDLSVDGEPNSIVEKIQNFSVEKSPDYVVDRKLDSPPKSKEHRKFGGNKTRIRSLLQERKLSKSRKVRQHQHKTRHKGHKHKHDDGPISLAVLAESGILIKSRKPKPYEYDEDFTKISGARSSIGSSTTSFASSDIHFSDPDSDLETASYVSCVTCLSDSVSSLSVNSSQISERPQTEYASVNGQIPTNSVIPYDIILNAKHVDVNDESLNKKKFPKITLNDNHHLIEITFARPRRNDVVPKRLTLLVEYASRMYSNKLNGKGLEDEFASDVVEEILRRSYKNSKRNRSLLVIINPFGGKRNAKKIFMRKAKRLLMASDFMFDLVYTKYSGHAIEIAKNMDIEKYDTIACASGDGIPHEVINGLYRRHDRVRAFNKLAITEIPCGSGNAMSVSCNWTNNPSYATLFIIKSVETRSDIMCLSQPSYEAGVPKLSFLSQTYGIIAESDINTEFIRWMGPARFELGVAFNILQRKKYPCDIYVKYYTRTKNELKAHYLKEIEKSKHSFEEDDSDSEPVTEEMFKVKYPLKDGVPSDWEKIDSALTDNLGIFYTGKMPYVAADTKFFPAALPDDGAIDMVLTDSRTPFTRMVPILLALDKGSHVLQPEVIHCKILAYKLIPKLDMENTVDGATGRTSSNGKVSSTGLFSVDGEKFPLEPLQVEIIPRLCKMLLRNGSYVNTEFDGM